MKLFYTLLLSLAGLLISSHSVAQGSLAALDAKNSFKGYIFGSSIDKCKGLVFDGFVKSKYDESFNEKLDWYLESEDLKTYNNTNKHSAIGDLKIYSPTYYFFNKKLRRIDFGAQIYVGKELIQVYKLLYGEPEITKSKTGFGSDIIIYTWRGKKVRLNMTFCANPYQGGTIISGSKPTPPWCEVVYLSLPMLSEIKGIKNQYNKNRANDL